MSDDLTPGDLSHILPHPSPGKLLVEQKAKMEKTLTVTKESFNTIRTGRASTQMLDRVMVRPGRNVARYPWTLPGGMGGARVHGRLRKSLVLYSRQRRPAGLTSSREPPRLQVDYFGTPTPVKNLASISTPDASTLVVQPFEKGALKDIEKAIMSSDVGEQSGTCLFCPSKAVPPTTTLPASVCRIRNARGERDPIADSTPGVVSSSAITLCWLGGGREAALEAAEPAPFCHGFPPPYFCSDTRRRLTRPPFPYDRHDSFQRWGDYPDESPRAIRGPAERDGKAGGRLLLQPVPRPPLIGCFDGLSC